MSFRLRSLVLALVVAAGASGVFFFRNGLDSPHRVVTALLTIAFFVAPESERPLRNEWWFLGVASTAWGARSASLGYGGLPLWAVSSLAGAFLSVRGGSRATRLYLPDAVSEEGERKRRWLRRELLRSVVLFFVGDLIPRIGPVAVALSAVFFVRYVLVQSKLTGVTPIPLSRASGIVPAQRWIVLSLFVVVGGTHYPGALVGEGGRGALLVTSALCAFLAALVFVLALVRSGWPRSVVRRTSFFAGVGVAVVLAGVLARLESWDANRFAIFTAAPVFCLVVLPFVRSETRLFERSPHLASLVPPPIVAAMLSPVTAMGALATSPSSGWLCASALLVLVYRLVVAVRERARGKLYLWALLGAMSWIAFHPRSDGAWQVFVLAVGLALYAVDLFDRLSRVAELPTA